MWVFASRSTILLGLIGFGVTVYLSVLLSTQLSDPTEGLTVVVAVLTAYLLLIEPKRRLEQKKLFWNYLADAVYEACHNLQHLAHSYQLNQKVHDWPECYVEAARRLMTPPFNDYMIQDTPHLWPHLDHIVRNDHYMQRHPFPNGIPKDAADTVEYFIEHCLRFVLAAARTGEGKAGTYVHRIVSSLGKSNLSGLLTNIPSAEAQFHVRIRKSDAQSDIDNGRYGLPKAVTRLYCFEPDGEPSDLWSAFQSMPDPPQRPEFSLAITRR